MTLITIDNTVTSSPKRIYHSRIVTCQPHYPINAVRINKRDEVITFTLKKNIAVYKYHFLLIKIDAFIYIVEHIKVFKRKFYPLVKPIVIRVHNY